MDKEQTMESMRNGVDPDGVPIMTVHEVADYLRLSEAKVYRLANLGCVPCFRLGKSWRFRKDLIDTWIERMAAEHLVEAG